MLKQCKMIPMPRLRHYSLLAVLTITASVIRCYQLLARSIWFDEAFTWRLVQFPWSELLKRAAHDVHPPLYYMAVKVWAIFFSSSLLSLRTFSITNAGLLILLVYGFTHTLTKHRPTSLLAAILVALSPWQIALSTEARMYTLTAVLTIGMLWALYRQRWVAFTMLAILVAYTHYYGLLILAAAAVWFGGSSFLRSPRPWRGILAFSVVAGAYLPWLPIFLRQLRQVQHMFWIPPFTRWSVPETLYHMLLGTTAEPHHQTFGQATLTLLPAVIIVVLILKLLHARVTRPTATLVSTVAGGTFLFSILASLLGQSVYQDRYFLPIHSLLLIILALSLEQITNSRARRMASLLTMLFFATATWQQYQRLDLPHHPGLQAAVRRLVTQPTQHEPLVVGSPFIFLPTLYYQQQEFTQLPTPRVVSSPAGLTHFAGAPVIQPHDKVPPDFFTSQAPTSFWLIDTTGFNAMPPALPARWKKSHEEHFAEVYPYQGDIVLTHYDPVR